MTVADGPFPRGDLLALTAALVDVGSVSFEEATLVGLLEAELARVPWLEVVRVGDNLVARTDLGRSQRLILAGHTDTVPPHPGDETARIEQDRLYGIGSSDMKGGLAVMVELARTVAEPTVDLTYVFYAREEVAECHSGLAELYETRPDLLIGDAALLGEPTDAAIEAGCQGTLRLEIVLRGARAHTARPWMGRNAIHRAASLLASLDAYEPRQPEIDGCQFREALQAVRIEGGVAGNVVPDELTMLVNHRFAPDRSLDEAERHVREVLGDVIEPDDVVVRVDGSGAAAPGLDHPLLRSLVDTGGLEVRAKLGWTDVARFAAHGIPAANFGPGDSTVAHTAGEYLDRAPLEQVYSALEHLVRGTAPTARS